MPRICPHCGTANHNQATFCGACATQMVSTSTALVPTRRKGAPLALSQRDLAAVGSVAVGLAAVALRVGAALLRHAATREEGTMPAAPAQAPDSLLIRRRWVTGDERGPLRWGEEEIEVRDGRETRGPFRITFK